ncbi:PREDICTED: uncharacterized protein LOC104611091 [Nelumbo nucifera]|uniref:DUF668 domain-containing protein/DUF3475 domain-containing protein n=2 Tax=Nelumbo nucifera TaxID=4432 RepID=A0A822YQV8_NELNU|nr:PREDICTED: uncharacterized protein LOC104611091 [Nelumbo nucifera]DAD33759.1 TPA_asm: hypothetical protein HUJ06_012610 [Nelumbo nucifera]
MALETWLIKVKNAISNGLEMARTTKKSNVGVLAFEITGLMSKLVHLWKSLSDQNLTRLRHESIALEGVRKIVSNDDAFLLGLACAETVENLRLVAKSVSRLGRRCRDSGRRCFDRLFEEFSNSGHDPHCWVLPWKEMESMQRKMDRYVTVTSTLHRAMDELSDTENCLRKVLQCSDLDQSTREKKMIDLQQKLFWQRQEVKHLKDDSLWSRSFDTVTLLLAKSIFTILARIKLVFGIEKRRRLATNSSSLSRSLTVSAAIHPSDNSASCKFLSGPLVMKTSKHDEEEMGFGLFEASAKILKPPPGTLGAAALALHYANLIIVIEKMIRSPQFVGLDARDDLYRMLPASIRMSLRARLRGVGCSATDSVLAGEWKDALARILGWLSPLAHNMIKWQSERSFEHQNLLPKTNVLLLQTLCFANQSKTEAAITELLVGLNYIWRFEREMSAKALFECSNMGC